MNKHAENPWVPSSQRCGEGIFDLTAGEHRHADLASAAGNQPKLRSRALGDIQASAGPGRRASIIDAHNAGAACVRQQQSRAERQRAMGGGQAPFVETLATGCVGVRLQRSWAATIPGGESSEGSAVSAAGLCGMAPVAPGVRMTSPVPMWSVGISLVVRAIKYVIKKIADDISLCLNWYGHKSNREDRPYNSFHSLPFLRYA